MELTIGEALIQVPERILSHATDAGDGPSGPNLNSNSAMGPTLPEAVLRAVQRVDVDIQAETLKNVLTRTLIGCRYPGGDAEECCPLWGQQWVPKHAREV